MRHSVETFNAEPRLAFLVPSIDINPFFHKGSR